MSLINRWFSNNVYVNVLSFVCALNTVLILTSIYSDTNLYIDHDGSQIKKNVFVNVI